MEFLVVGANRGLGAVLSQLLADKGHHVFAGIVGNNYDQRLQRNDITILPMDVTDEKAIEKASLLIKNKGKLLDGVVNVAGILLPDDEKGTILEVSTETYIKSFEINTLGNIILARYALPVLKRGGKFILITSEAGSVTNNGSGFPAYSISKTAANKVAYILKETYQDEFDFLAVHPGRMNTEMGAKTAQIEPEESAEGIKNLLVEKDLETAIFIDYSGKRMEI